MNRIKKLFGGIEMTWLRVIIFAVVVAAYTALINQVPFLEDTSFQDIAVTYECWIVFAVIIVTNCNKWWEAALKCFVFFLVSQPLIFLIEVPFEGWGVFIYYKEWFFVTLLTLPGGAIAYLVKRKDYLATASLSVATAFLSYIGINYFNMAIHHFPHHLLSSIFCIAVAVLFVFVLLDEKKHRIIGIAVIVVAIVASFIIKGVHFSKATKNIELGSGEWTYSMEDASVADISIDDNGTVTITEAANGTSMITFTDAEGNIKEYLITVSGGDIILNSFD